jgi:hypothetical protein
MGAAGLAQSDALNWANAIATLVLITTATWLWRDAPTQPPIR